MRMSRWAWLARFFTARVPRGPRPKRERREPTPKRTWIVLGQRFEAHTKSEARALAKAALGYRERLPVGTVVIEERR